MKSRFGSMVLFFALALVPLQMVVQQAQAQSSYFANRGCVDCHAPPATATCNGCHYHGNRSLKATTDKTSYAPGETVSVTLTTSSTRSGWIKAILYGQTGAQIAASSGNASGMGGATTFPATLAAPAPTTPGTYTWRMAYFGNSANTGDAHGEVAVNTNTFTVAAAGDTAAPTVSTFTLPATATSLTVPVSALTATDDVGVTGYMVTTSPTPPAASAAGWTAAAPTNVTAVAGNNSFYAWAKDAAGNVSAAKTASVAVTLPDTTPPTVGTFTLPATATTLTVPVSALNATDNVGVTGYMITKTSSAPAASAAEWTASAPANVTATEGNNTFYAWAKDAAGNVSTGKSASVTVTMPDTKVPTVSSFTLPATATSLTVPVSALTATDDIGVTGYLITTDSTAPAASAAGWTPAAPANVTAKEGNNTFYAWVKDAAGNVSLAKTATVVVTTTATEDTTKPGLVVSTLATGSYTNKPTVNISGTTSDDSGIESVTVNGQPATVNPDGSFSTALNFVPGENTITVIAVDKKGNEQTDSRTITYDPTAPVLTVSSPADNSSSTQSFVTLTGSVSETATVKVTDNAGSPVTASMDGNNFTATVNLAQGVNTINISATDLAGNSVSEKRTVTYSSGAALTLSVIEPKEDVTTRKPEIILKGTVTEGVGEIRVKVSKGGESFCPVVRDGKFKQKLIFGKFGVHPITVLAADSAGNRSTVTRNVIYCPKKKKDDRKDERDRHHQRMDDDDDEDDDRDEDDD